MTEDLKEWMEEFEAECESHECTSDLEALIEIKEIIETEKEAEEIIRNCIYYLGNACASYKMPDAASDVWRQADNFLNT